MCVSTRSRPKAAGNPAKHGFAIAATFQHAAARRRLGGRMDVRLRGVLFQHAAARRRLGRTKTLLEFFSCFNTQPPEGGWRRFR